MEMKNNAAVRGGRQYHDGASGHLGWRPLKRGLKAGLNTAVFEYVMIGYSSISSSQRTLTVSYDADLPITPVKTLAIDEAFVVRGPEPVATDPLSMNTYQSME